MLVSLSMIQAEADILEYSIRANLRHLDHMIFMLNPSEDGAGNVLDALVQEGLPITVWRTRRNHYAQSEMLGGMLERVRDQMDPDFLLFLDADEILLVDETTTLRRELASIPHGGVGQIAWMTFIPPENEQDYVFRREGWNTRLDREVTQFYKVIIPRAVLQQDDLCIPNGQHLALRAGKEIPFTLFDGIQLAHLPVRSVPQIRTKVFSSIINKGLAEGTAWRGRESTQLECLLTYLEENDAPDVRQAARLYLCWDWSSGEQQPCIHDARLPCCPVKYQHLIRALPLDNALLQRVSASIFPLPDPTNSLQSDPEHACKSQPSPTGIFSAAFHAQNLMCDWPPFDYVARRFKPHSVVDIGCGLGAYLALFRAEGSKVLGVDGDSLTPDHFLTAAEYIARDLERERLTLDRAFDVSVCTEVLEHISEQAALHIVDELSRCTQTAIVFSAAQLEQPGYAHITLRDPIFWLARFEQQGWKVDIDGTYSLRMLSTLHWFRRNLFLLRRESNPGPLQLSRLLALGVHRTAWPGHRPGETVIGFPGQRWSFNMHGERQVPPLPSSNPLTPERISDGLKEKITNLEEQLQGAYARLQAIDAENQKLGREIALSEAAKTDADRRLTAVYASSSWRVTAPLRKLKAVMSHLR